MNDRRGDGDGLVLTLDVDWAPDCVIDAVADLLAAAEVRATWFVTHRSPAIERLRQHVGLFELGIHPNFLPGSSHGATVEEVIDHCLEFVPDALSLRTHALVQSSPLIAHIIRNTPLRVDFSLFLPGMRNIRPVQYRSEGRSHIRVPYFWEDDDEMQEPRPLWRLDGRFDGPGLKVLDFHPIHVYLNSANMAPYRALCARMPLSEATIRHLEPFVNEGRGVRTFFLDVMERLRSDGGGARARDIFQATGRPS